MVVFFRMAGCLILATTFTASLAAAERRPNVLIAVSDDQSYPHASAYGYQAIQTPNFDRVAREGVLFHNAFSPAPGCSPMRAAFLTGRNIWQLEHAGTHASSFPAKYVGFQDQLEESGYFVGFTGKGWGPGNWEADGRTRNPAGPQYSKRTAKTPPGIRATDYAANFADFLAERPKDQPFSFWYGGSEPHRVFEKGIGRRNGLDPDKVVVPPFLPDTPEIRDDLLDYCYEIQWFDQHLGRMLDLLEEAGELENTLVIVTSDNGMAFPAAKANAYEYGIHMPLAIAWPAKIPGDRVVNDLVNLIDVTATIYAATDVKPPEKYPLSGKSLLGLLESDASGVVEPQRNAIFSGRERHSSSRYNSLGYPQRCIRTADYLYIRNFRPERWPAGAPRKFGHGQYAKGAAVTNDDLGPEHGGYHDIDACPALDFLIEHRDDPKISRFFHLAVDKRPAEELFDIRTDPGCLNNLAGDPRFAEVQQQLSARLMDYLKQTGDARVTASDGGDIWETYRRYSKLRWFPKPDWAKEHPERVPQQDWVEERRPK
ncbi:Arylsulfatase precursor [Symmachiella macrocystis]|uniref:Arylsulfatase n=1 Tax=Symmachiella macrocystis TaxID=2527985 RepID=A0A5C6BJX5_9PLAN|nr:sulfatase [Symmachiella macrocystis]TWU11489.1 Arylsulfatase precursor [Symmachiella macrocystis]